MLDIDALARQLGYDAAPAGEPETIEAWTEQHLRLGDWWTSPTGESLQIRMIYRPDSAALLGESTHRCIVDLHELRRSWAPSGQKSLLSAQPGGLRLDWGRPST